MKAAAGNEGGTKRTLPQLIKDLLLLPTRIAISAPARKAYLTTFLLLLASSFLALTSVVTYAIFYWTYIPSPSFTIPIHFDFSTTSHPIAAYPLASPWTPLLTSNQPYDVALSLELPRTRANVAAGNFMLDLRLLSPSASSASSADLTGITPYTANLTHILRSNHPRILAHSRRPATLTYRTPLLELAMKAMWAPLYLIGWQQESEVLQIEMMKDVSFKRGWKNVPRAVLVELQTQARTIPSSATTNARGVTRTTRPKLQVYWAKVTFTARLQGLRWLMYRHRVLSFLICTSLFWAVEMAVAVTVWAVASFMYYRGKRQQAGDYAVVKAEDKQDAVRVKQEEDDEDTMSDTSRSFPTYSRQPPLRYSGTAARIKQEEEAEEAAIQEDRVPVMPVVPTAAEGDVEDEYEDEDADFVLEQRFERLAGDSGGVPRRGDFDSGIGSSMESSSGRGGDLRRRTSSRGAR